MLSHSLSAERRVSYHSRCIIPPIQKQKTLLLAETLYSTTISPAVVLLLKSTNSPTVMGRQAVENGGPWDRHTCSGAALNGHLHIILQ